MGKRLISLLCILGLVSLNVNFYSPIIADFEVDTTITYSYEIIEAKMKSKIEKQSLVNTGIVIGDQNVAVGSILEYDIINYYSEDDALAFTITYDNEIILYHSSNPINDLNDLRELLTLAILLYYIEFSTFGYSDNVFGIPFLFSSPFLDLDYWRNYTNSHVVMDKYTELNPNIVKEFINQSNTAGYYLEASFNGELHVMLDVTMFNVTFNNQLQLSYNEKGVMLGVKIDSWIDGIINDIDFYQSINYQVELADYDLPDYQLTGLKNNRLGIDNPLVNTSIAICSLVGIGVFLRKKRK